MEPFVFPASTENDDEEWEECQPGEEGCEEVEVDDEGKVFLYYH